MYCSNCGASFSHDALFCWRCGRSHGLYKVCPSCKTHLFQDTSYCWKCGKSQDVQTVLPSGKDEVEQKSLAAKKEPVEKMVIPPEDLRVVVLGVVGLIILLLAIAGLFGASGGISWALSLNTGQLTPAFSLLSPQILHFQLQQHTIDIVAIISNALVILGTLYLAYDLLGREDGPLQWLTLVLTCGVFGACSLGVLGFGFAYVALRNSFSTFEDMLQFVQLTALLGMIMGIYSGVFAELSLSKSSPGGLWKRRVFAGIVGVVSLYFIFLVLTHDGNGYHPAESFIDASISALVSVFLGSTGLLFHWMESISPSKPRFFSRGRILIRFVVGFLTGCIPGFILSRDLIAILISGLIFALVNAFLGGLLQRIMWRFIYPKVSNAPSGFFSWKKSLAWFIIGLVFGFFLVLIPDPDFSTAMLSAGIIALVSGLLGGIWRSIHRVPPEASRPRFSGSRFLIGFGIGLVSWFLISAVLTHIYSKDPEGAVVGGVLLALAVGMLNGIGQFIGWVSPNVYAQQNDVRRRILIGLITGMVPWFTFVIIFFIVSPPVNSFNSSGVTGEIILGLSVVIFFMGIMLFAFAVATINAFIAGLSHSILRCANKFPTHTLGAIGLVFLLLAAAMQFLPPLAELLNIISKPA
jgi:uncharacterized OB-fold protein